MICSKMFHTIILNHIIMDNIITGIPVGPTIPGLPFWPFAPYDASKPG